MTPLAALALSGALLSAAPDEAKLPTNHPPIGSASKAAPSKGAPSGEELIKQLDATPGVKDGDKPFEIAVTLGHLYASNARYVDAIDFFRQAEQKAEPLRTFFLAARKETKGELAEAKDCPQTDALEKQLGLLESLPAPRRAACALAALVPALEATNRRGNLHLLQGDSKSALAAWSAVLEVSPRDPEALYLSSALILETEGEDLVALKGAKASLEQLLQWHKVHPRVPQAQKLVRTLDEAIAAGGMKKRAQLRAEDRKVRLSQGIPKASAVAARPPMQKGPMQGATSEPVVTQETMEAFQNMERTPELEAKLTKLLDEGEEHLARGQFDQALAAYRQVMPLRPDDPRTRAGLAWAMVKLNRQPMADRVWGVATSDPKSVETLGDALKAKGDLSGAKAVWTRLAETRPDYAATLKAKLQ